MIPRSSAAAALPALALLFNAFTWGVSWWPFRQLQAHGLHPLLTTAVLYATASALLLLRWPGALAQLLKTRALWPLVLASGCTNAAFNWAVAIGDVVRVVLLFYLMPLWSMLLAWGLLGERPSRGGAWRVALSLTGALVVLWPDPAGAAAWHAAFGLADLLAVAGGACFALNNVMLKREAAQPAGARAVAMFAGGCLVSLTLAALLGLAAPHALAATMHGLGSAGLAALAGLALWFTLSNLALQYGAARLSAHTTSLIMVTELFFASASAGALGAAELGLRALLGAAFIVAAALLAARAGP